MVPPLKQSEASRSPKLNGAVERTQRTHTEEFYRVTHSSLERAALNRELREREKTYNTVRRHQFLGYLSPPNTCSSGMLIEGTECVTNLLDNLGVIGSRL